MRRMGARSGFGKRYLGKCSNLMFYLHNHRYRTAIVSSVGVCTSVLWQLLGKLWSRSRANRWLRCNPTRGCSWLCAAVHSEIYVLYNTRRVIIEKAQAQGRKQEVDVVQDHVVGGCIVCGGGSNTSCIMPYTVYHTTQSHSTPCKSAKFKLLSTAFCQHLCLRCASFSVMVGTKRSTLSPRGPSSTVAASYTPTAMPAANAAPSDVVSRWVGRSTGTWGLVACGGAFGTPGACVLGHPTLIPHINIPAASWLVFATKGC